MKKTKLSLLTLAFFFSTNIVCMELATTEQDSPLLNLSPELYINIINPSDITTVNRLKRTCKQLNADTHYYQTSPEIIKNANSTICTPGLAYFAQTHAQNIKNNTLENNLIQNNPMLEANFKHLLLNNPDEREIALMRLSWDINWVKTCSTQAMMNAYTTLPNTLSIKRFKKIIDNPTALRIITSINPNTTDYLGNTILHYACSEDKPEVVKSFLKIPGIDVNKINTQGVPPLFAACRTNKRKTVQLLLNAGADPKFAQPSGGTAFHYACNYSSTEVIKLLLNALAPDFDINKPGSRGLTPLHWACLSCRPETVQLLLTIPSIDLDIKDSAGKTPLDILNKRICIGSIPDFDRTQVIQLLTDHQSTHSQK